MDDELEIGDARNMEDTIRAKLDEINRREADEDLPDEEPPFEPPSLEDNEDEAPESPDEKAARLRDGKGRFTKLKAQGAEAGAMDSVPDAQAAVDAPKRPPNSWSPKAKADFSALPPHIQAEVLKREADFHRGIEGYRSDAQFAQSIRRIAQPYEATIRAEGGQVEGAFADYLNSAFLLRTGSPAQKAHFVRQLIQQFGVPLPLAEQAQAGAAPQLDPVVAQLLDKVGQLENHFTSQQVAAKQEAERQSRLAFEQFAADPSRTFFDDVRHDMAALIGSHRAKSLEEAYDMACWARPDIRALLLQQQEKARREAAQHTAREARRAAGHNVTRRGAVAAVSARGSIEDTIRAEMQRLGIQQGA